MTLPQSIRARLESGRAVAAEMNAPHTDARSYLVILPQAPRQRDFPDRWLHSGTGEPWLRDVNDITGYELRYLQHHARYTDTEWGWDYDHVLADVTTRVKRIVVRTIDDIERALTAREIPHTSLQHPHAFDSSLVNSPIEGYLEQVDLYPHLWQP